MERQIKHIDKEDREVSLSEKMSTVFLALFIGIVADRFFVDRSLGISYPIFLTLVISFFFWTLRKKLEFRKSIGWFLLLPILLLSLTFALFTNEILMLLNFILIPFLMICSSLLISDYSISWDNVNFIGKVLERAIPLTVENFTKPIKFMRLGGKSTNIKEMSSTKKGILKGLLISFPLLFVILTLLSSADMVFQHYIGNIIKAFDILELDFSKSIPHIIIIGVVSLYLFGYTWSFRYPSRNSKIAERKTASWEAVTILTIVFILNVVYLIFTVIQFSYLYGGGTNVLPQDYTYAEYARKGFFELVAVTIINFAILMSSMKYMKKDNRFLNNIANVFLTLLILFTLNMLFSAHYKMSLYESSYGLTYLRVFVHYFMLLLFLLFLMGFATIWYKKFPLTKAILATSLIMYVILNYINIDAIIADSNIKRYHETGKIDVNYLRHLSQEAIPYMVELYDDKNPDVRTPIKIYLDSREKNINEIHSWYEFNYSIYKAKKSLQELD